MALVTKKEVSQVFAADLNRCCLVLQVAVYPKKDEPIDLSLVDFALLEVGTDKPMRAESPTVVAARSEKKKNPSGGVDVTPVGSIGYETGVYIDPVNGPACASTWRQYFRWRRRLHREHSSS